MIETQIDEPHPPRLRRWMAAVVRIVVTIVLGALVAFVATYLLRKFGV